jgi:DNA-binding MarR family transcriptional regulator
MTQPPEPPSAATLDDDDAVRQQLITGLLKIGLATRHRAWQGGEALGLSPTQGQVLVLLLSRSGKSTRIGDIATELAVSQPTASVTIRALIAKGLVERVTAVDDKRAVDLRLTPSGRDLARQALGWSDFLLAAVDDLDGAEQAVFQRSIVKMIRAMQLRGEISVSRMCPTCQFFRPNAHPHSPQPHHCAFVDAPFGDRQLRLDCADFQPASAEMAEDRWVQFVAAR